MLSGFPLAVSERLHSAAGVAKRVLTSIPSAQHWQGRRDANVCSRGPPHRSELTCWRIPFRVV